MDPLSSHLPPLMIYVRIRRLLRERGDAHFTYIRTKEEGELDYFLALLPSVLN